MNVHSARRVVLLVATAILLPVLLTRCAGSGSGEGFDFAEHLDQATILTGEGRSEPPKGLDTGLSQPAGTEIAYQVFLPNRARLQLGEVFFRGAGPDTKLIAEVALRRRGGSDRRLFSTREAGSSGGQEIDLSALAGNLVEIVFRVRSNSREPGAGVVWEHPRLAGEPDDASRTNVLLIVLDTLRTDYLGCYGGEIATPNIDALAASSVTFENAYSHIPITGPAHSSMFTSLFPSQLGVLCNTNVLDPEYFTLAEAMRASNRYTSAIVALGVLSARYGFEQGFDHYDDHFQGTWWRTAAEVNDLVIPQLSPPDDRRFFVFAHYSDPHEPYAAPDGVFPQAKLRVNGEIAAEFPVNGTRVRVPVTLRPGSNEVLISVPGGITLREVHAANKDVKVEFVEGWKLTMWKGNVFKAVASGPASLDLRNDSGESVKTKLTFFSHEPTTPGLVKKRYAEEVHYLDAQLGKLFDTMKQQGLWENTLIVLTADHGESLYEHGHLGHVSQLYDTLVRVPLIISLPGRLPAGKRIKQPVAHIDILPTILGLLNLTSDIPMEGRDLRPLINGGGEFPPRRILAETHRPESSSDLRAVVDGTFKFIRDLTRQTEELYNFTDDSGETKNLIQQNSAAAAELRQALDADFKALLSRGKSAPISHQPSPEELKKLRSLGYLR